MDRVSRILGGVIIALIVLLILMSCVRSYGAEPDEDDYWIVTHRFLVAMDKESILPLAKAINDKDTQKTGELISQHHVGGLPSDTKIHVIAVRAKSQEIPVAYVECRVVQGDKDTKRVYVFQMYFDPRTKYLKKFQE